MCLSKMNKIVHAGSFKINIENSDILHRYSERKKQPLHFEMRRNRYWDKK